MTKKIKNIEGGISKLRLILSMIGVAIVGVIIVGISFYGLDNKANHQYTLEQFNSDFDGSTFSIEASDTSYSVGEENNIIVKLNGNGQKINTADLVLKFDPSKIEINESRINISLFGNYTKKLNNSTGIFEISAGPDPSKLDTIVETSGYETFAIIGFKLKNSSNTSLEILCRNGLTNDSNIMVGSQDLYNCSAVSRKVEFTNISNNDGNNPTPTPVPDNDGNGGNNNVDNQDLSSPGDTPPTEPWCKKTPPSRPTNLQAETTGVSGQVKLTWDRVSEEVTHYTVTYGTKWLDFDYGQPNIGNTDQFLVNGLANGVGYYFTVTAVNDCASSGYSDGAAAYAGWIPGSGTGGSTTSTTNTSTYDYWGTSSSEEKGYEYDYEDYDYVEDEDEEASESSDYEDDYDYDEDDYEEEIIYTPEPTVEPYEPDETNEQDNNLSKALPLIGLGVLALLGVLFIVLTKFARKDVSNLE